MAEETPPMMLAVAASSLLAVVGLVLCLEGGPHSRMWAARLLLMAILIVAAMPALLCWLLRDAPGVPAVPTVDPGHAAVPCYDLRAMVADLYLKGG